MSNDIAKDNQSGGRMNNFEEKLTCENYVVKKLLCLEQKNEKLTYELDKLNTFIQEEIEKRVNYKVKGKLSRIKVLESEKERQNEIIDSYQPRLQKYKDVLQEIKAIAENGTKTEDYLLGQRYTDLIDRILDLITKAESEEE